MKLKVFSEVVRHVKRLLQALVLWLLPLVGALIALSSAAALAKEVEQSSQPSISAVTKVDIEDNTARVAGRWGFAFENDFFVPGGRDQDYTYGMSVSYSSSEMSESNWQLPLRRIDQLLGLSDGKFDRYGFEGGLYGFTPEDTSVAEANANDRPYASLVYFSSIHERFNPMAQTVLRTQLSLGVLGLDIVGQVQDEFHALIANDRPQGWDNQISSGGELTARYSLSRQKLLLENKYAELRHTQAVSVGYLSELSWSLSFRAGHLNSSWYNFNPELASYAEAASSVNRGYREHFVWGGVAVKGRAYNAFLQGQFNDSAVSYSSDELNHIIVEAWAGVTQSFRNAYFLSFGVRGHQSEVRVGDGNRTVLWGGLTMGRQFY